MSQDSKQQKPTQELDAELTTLFDMCDDAKKASYSPYSKFRVGCALKTKDGKYFKGCNVENSSYGLSICAERTALVKAVSEGYRSFSAIAVTADVVDTFISPCGACRQFISEFGEVDVYFVKPDRTYLKTKISELLPYGFAPSDLDRTRINQ